MPEGIVWLITAMIMQLGVTSLILL